jgi:uncharacterized damage-inducible protein DinB
MQVADVLIDGYGRIREEVARVLDGLSDDELGARLDPDANSIAWLVWHLTRVQDDHMADAFGVPQAWTDGGWADRFGLPLPPSDTGYGHRREQVAALGTVTAELLRGYHEATWERTVGLLRTVTPDGLDRIVDTRWDPPVSLGVRLVSVLADDLQHVGQAAYARGLLDRRGR